MKTWRVAWFSLLCAFWGRPLSTSARFFESRNLPKIPMEYIFTKIPPPFSALGHTTSMQWWSWEGRRLRRRRRRRISNDALYAIEASPFSCRNNVAMNISALFHNICIWYVCLTLVLVFVVFCCGETSCYLMDHSTCILIDHPLSSFKIRRMKGEQYRRGIQRNLAGILKFCGQLDFHFILPLNSLRGKIHRI